MHLQRGAELRVLHHAVGVADAVVMGHDRIMAKRRWRFLSLFIALPACGLAGKVYASGAAIPPLLKGVRSASGWNYLGCPYPSSRKVIGVEAVSPNLMQRLSVAYPAGSDPENLRAALLADGFKLLSPCTTDPTIQHASFQQVGVIATVAWKLSPAGKIEWTKGFVEYDGL